MKTLESENNWVGTHDACWINCATVSPSAMGALFEKYILRYDAAVRGFPKKIEGDKSTLYSIERNNLTQILRLPTQGA